MEQVLKYQATPMMLNIKTKRMRRKLKSCVEKDAEIFGGFAAATLSVGVTGLPMGLTGVMLGSTYLIF